MSSKRAKSPDIKPKKRISKLEIEQNICRGKLDKLEFEESRDWEDRFSLNERKILLDAFDEVGFKVFQDVKLLSKYLPNRRESDLHGLIQRLKTSLCSNIQGGNQNFTSPIDLWQRRCQQFMTSFAKDKKINLDEVFSHALTIEAESIRSEKSAQELGVNDPTKPDYTKLIESFADLLSGKFPDNLNPLEAQISARLFNHLNTVVDSLDLTNGLTDLRQGTWVDSLVEEQNEISRLGLEGLEQFDIKIKKCPSHHDITSDKRLEALCLELPKIKRITDVLNPLSMSESIVSSLMDHPRNTLR